MIKFLEIILQCFYIIIVLKKKWINKSKLCQDSLAFLIINLNTTSLLSSHIIFLFHVANFFLTLSSFFFIFSIIFDFAPQEKMAPPYSKLHLHYYIHKTLLYRGQRVTIYRLMVLMYYLIMTISKIIYTSNSVMILTIQ